MRRSLNILVEQILLDAAARLGVPRSHWSTEGVSWYAFPQRWGSTALGFGGIGGQMMTTAQTIVVLAELKREMVVYFDGRFAYKKPVTEKLKEALLHMRMPARGKA